MYKRFKITKRKSISFETFRKKVKKQITIPKSYHTGIHKHSDDINSIDFYSLTIYTFRITLIIEQKNPRGHCSG